MTIELNTTYGSLVFETLLDDLHTDADALPVGALYRNGVLEGTVPVTVATTADAGWYLFQFTTLGTVDGWAEDDHVVVRIFAIIDSQTYSALKFDSVNVSNVSSGVIISAISALNDISAADVNAEVLDVLNVDTFAELAATPAATTTIRSMIQALFMMWRNKSTETQTERTLFADDDTTIVSQEAVSDDGTTFTKNKAS